MSRRSTSGKLNTLKLEAAAEIGMTQYLKENKTGYKGDLPSKVNGAQGGPIGGRMVQKIIRSMEERMATQL